MQTNFTCDVIETTLLGLAKRIDATTRNIANMNTPQYARKEISFEAQLSDVIKGPVMLPLKTTDPQHISNVTRTVQEVKPHEDPVGDQVYRGDSNNVDPETEIARLTETRMMYDVLALRMGGKFRDLRRVLSNGPQS